MRKRIVQVDNFDIVELWADGKCQLRARWSTESHLFSEVTIGSLSLYQPEANKEEPGIIRALRNAFQEEGL
jgi:hypothetical protein